MSKSTTKIEVQIELVSITCYLGECGITFAVPELWQRDKRRSQTVFWCPNGHTQGYYGETEEQKLRKQLEQTQRESRDAWQRVEQLQNDNMDLAKSRAAARGQVTKLRKKSAAGECPAGCHRWFKDLESHITAEHPEFGTEVDGE